MGLFVNPGNQSFTFDLNSKIYVDKSLMVCELNELFGTAQRFVCMSRARRFGKTMMANLLAAYYSKNCDSRELFEKLKLSQIEGWDKYLNAVNVIQIDLNSWYSRTVDKSQTIKELQAGVVCELRKQFPSVEIPSDAAIASAISVIHEEVGDSFVIIIDEYDVLLRDDSVSSSLRREYLEFLNSIFKANDTQKAISLAYLTGILPILRERVQSKLNNFSEFTMLTPGPFAQYFGLTAKETEEVCLRNDADFEMCKFMYDGYTFPKSRKMLKQPDDDGEPVVHMFNPNSVVKAVMWDEYKNYWVTTSALEAITFYLDANIEGIKDDIMAMLKGERDIKINVELYNNNVECFATKDEVFTYLIHLGYLAYDPLDESCHIPNAEIRQAWFNIMSKAKGFEPIRQMLETGRALIESTEKGDTEAVTKALDDSHADISSPLSYNRESTMQSAILMAYFYARKEYMIFSELPTGCGYADVVLVPTLPKKPVIIIELKKDGDPAVALQQIRTRNYAHAFRHHPGKSAVLVGIAYDAESKHHKCLIEKVEDYRELFGVLTK